MKEKTLYHTKNEGTIGLVVICIIIPFLWFMLPYALNAATEFIVTDRRIRIKKSAVLGQSSLWIASA
ncbi:MAG: hypothetical protein IJX39_01355 [Clostridia bacterium]|nr:hypothetical protein [Clostridia bacterium]